MPSGSPGVYADDTAPNTSHFFGPTVSSASAVSSAPTVSQHLLFKQSQHFYVFEALTLDY
jgi:hypothetical protein